MFVLVTRRCKALTVVLVAVIVAAAQLAAAQAPESVPPVKPVPIAPAVADAGAAAAAAPGPTPAGPAQVSAAPVANPGTKSIAQPSAAGASSSTSAQAAASTDDNAAFVPPAANVDLPAAESASEHSFFWRPALRVDFGDGWGITLYGFAQADFIFDSTRSYDDAIGGSLVARSDTYASRTGRTQFSARNTRIGLAFTSPSFAGAQASAVIESDFFGNQPPAPGSVGADERLFFDSPTLRLRQAYLQLRTEYVDLLAGQSYAVLGFQNYFFPCSLEFLGLPNQLFSREVQLRASRSFALPQDLSLEAALAVLRPAQRDAAVPDFQAGVRLSFQRWKGITTPGNVGTLALPLSVGLSGTVRSFKVNAFAPPPTQRSNSATGWGVALDALVPIIAARDQDDRANRLTFTGSFVTGSGIADLITAGGGAAFPTLPNPAQGNPPPLYTPNVDAGLLSFDTQGVAHTIDWWALRAGLQYYLPPTGRAIVSVNYTQAHSGNMSALFPRGGAEIELLTRVANRSHYADINLMWDATAAMRVGVSGQYTKVLYLDGDAPHNFRATAQAVYAF